MMISAGYQSARQVTHAHGRSFAFAAFALGAKRRRAAYAIYAFFRRLDDAFDSGNADASTLNEARRALDWLFGHQAPRAEFQAWPRDELQAWPRDELQAWPRDELQAWPRDELQAWPRDELQAWPRDEMEALRDAITQHGLPRAPFDDMLTGMEMDLRGQTYPDVTTLDLYCDRVAGTVGELMATLLGATERRALDAAVRLGRAMQLTNILRDVAEDRRRGRVYVPDAELQRFSLSASDLTHVDERWTRLSAAHIERARGLYASAREGTVRIESFFGRWLVEMLAGIYGDILRSIEKRGHDVFTGRARVSLPRKLVLMCSAFFAAFRARV